MSRKWTRTEKWTVAGVLVVLILGAVAFFTPELRRLVRLDKPVSKASTRPAAQPAAAAPQEPARTEPLQSANKPPYQHEKPSPASTVTASGGGTAVGTISQGPGSIAQVGGIGNTAIIGAAPIPPRVLTVDEMASLTRATAEHPATILILYDQGDTEAYRLGNQIANALTAAGWTLKQPVSPSMIMSEGGQPMVGLLMNIHGEKVAPGTRVPFEPGKPWTALARELMRTFPEDLHVQLSPDGDDDHLVLIVCPNPRASQ